MPVRRVMLDRTYRVVSDTGAPVAIRLNGADLTPSHLVSGFVPRHVVDVFGLKVMDFELADASDQKRAFWILDQDFGYLTNDVNALSLELLRAINVAIAQLAAELIRLTLSAPPAETEHRPNRSALQKLGDDITDLSALDRSTIVALLAPLYCRPDTRPFDEPCSYAGADVTDILRERIRRIIDQPAIEWQDGIVSSGHISIDCPLTGMPLTGRWSLPIDDITTAYPFVDGENETLVLLVGSYHSRPCALFSPARRKIWCIPEAATEAVNCALGVLAHMTQHARAVFDYLLSKPDRCVTSIRMWHVGHHLFNELSGLERLHHKDMFCFIDRVIIVDPTQTQHFGPIDHYFPALASRIIRLDGGASSLAEFVYGNSLFLFRVTGNGVPLALVGRVHEFVDNNAEPAAPRQPAELRIVLGLRVENRTWINQASGLVALLRHLRETHSRVTAVIDGHNGMPNSPGRFLRSFREETAKAPPIEIERSIVALLEQKFRDDSGVRVVSCVGMTVPDNLAQIASADLFVAPWGAGLAKYKWVYNMQGVILCSNWNRRYRTDLMLYETGDAREGATRCVYLPETAIEDLVDDIPLVDTWNNPSFHNFRVDETAMFAAVDDLIDTLGLPHDPARAADVSSNGP